MSYQSTVLADSPALYWRCSEESGPTLEDASGNAQTGTAQGGVTFAAAGVLRADGSRALSLDGVLANDYQARVLADAPVAYWPLQETSGTAVADASGHGFDATSPGGTVTLGASGPYGQTAAHFADTSATTGMSTGPGIQIDDPSALPVAPGAMTIECWINPREPAALLPGGVHNADRPWAIMSALYWGSPDFTEPYFILDLGVVSSEAAAPWDTWAPDGAPAVASPDIYEADAGFVSPISPNGLPDAGWEAGTWHHVALTWDNLDNPDGFAVYLDGAPWTTGGAYAYAFDVQTGTPTFGVLGSGGASALDPETLYGSLAHVALYDHALAPARVLAHYLGLAAPGAGTLVVQDATSTLPAAASIEVWLRTTTTQGGVLAQFATADGTQRDLTLYLRSDGVPAWRAGATEIVRSLDRTVADGRIHHLVATLDGDAAAWLYVDGTQAAHAEGVVPGSPFTGRWQIGAGTTLDLAVPPASAAYAGTIDEVAIYVD